MRTLGSRAPCTWDLAGNADGNGESSGGGKPRRALETEKVMLLKFGNWLIGIGCLFAVVGLCFLPAAFGPHPDPSLLSGGAMLFSLGMVFSSGGFYVKARCWRDETTPARSRAPEKHARRILCTLCGKNEVLIHCRVHRLQLCSACIGQHYDFRTCVYVPTTGHAPSRAMAYTQGR